MRATHTITINQDDICENNPNENFFVAINSDLPIINVIRTRTEVIIDDSECSKCHILFVLLCYVVVHKYNNIHHYRDSKKGEKKTRQSGILGQVPFSLCYVSGQVG